MNERPLFSVCIPAYNRAALLAPLLESILAQSFENFEVLICEDGSPERTAITEQARRFQALYPGKIRYKENVANLGYDGNIRELVASANGRFCVFMGNDDLMCPGALDAIAQTVAAEPNCAVVVRTYASFDEDPARPKQVFRYFPDRTVFEGGAAAITVAYRRSVVISGLVIDRDEAHAVATTRFDGTLLYQLYLVGMVLKQKSVTFVPEIIALRRDGNLPDFGNSAAEKGKFVPHDQTPDSSVHFVAGMISIAKHIEDQTGLIVYDSILRDIGNYSYPILSIQAQRNRRVFAKYAWQLGRLGLSRFPLFHVYAASLLIMGPGFSDWLIGKIKQRLGYTPLLGATKLL